MKESINIEDFGLTDKQIIELFGNDRYAEFINWMSGQTISIVNGQDVYYYFDIKRFLLK